MKLRSKSGSVLFILNDPKSERTWTIDPRRRLSAEAAEKMSTHPDMILQYSHYLAEQKRRDGHAGVEVRAHALVSLNGRRPQKIVDPEVNLDAKKRSLGHAEWILPLTVPLGERWTDGADVRNTE
jgi:vitamin K-dependent gamma-carboxylase